MTIRTSPAIYYSRAAFTETSAKRNQPNAIAGQPQGLVGREVANHEFLTALLRHGNWPALDVLLESPEDRAPFVELCQTELADSASRRRVRIHARAETSQWIKRWDAGVLHFPSPPDDQIIWARQRWATGQFAISALTHTLCSLAGMDSLWRLVTGPWQSYDRLICTSRAVESMVLAATQQMCEYFDDRCGGNHRLRIGLERLPLGVDLQRHRPARSEERDSVRTELRIPADALVALYVGRLSHHAKGQPYPMFACAQYAAERAGRPICLLLAGWFANEATRLAYERTAKRLAPNVRLIIVDGLDPRWRREVWHAADVFVSLPDSIQETFGLTPLEAMARRLPVLASDWNGYRDTILDGETGLLVPTSMVRDATADLTGRLVAGELSYDQFLARAGQSVCVSIPDACQAMLRLACDSDLRRDLGSAGRQRAEQHYGWGGVITSLEGIWKLQSRQLRNQRLDDGAIGPGLKKRGLAGPLDESLPRPATNGALPQESPSRYPPIDLVFASYPTRWFDPHAEFAVTQNAADSFASLMDDPLVNHSLEWLKHADGIGRWLSDVTQPITVERLKAELAHLEPPIDAAAAVAWLHKYDLIRPLEAGPSPKVVQTIVEKPIITFVTTCMGRLSHVQQSIPLAAAQHWSSVVLVDYSCPQAAGDWVRRHYPNVKVVSVPNKTIFDRSDAKNTGVSVTETAWICLLDADVLLAESFVERVVPLLVPGRILRSASTDQVEGVAGTILCQKRLFDYVGGHDPVFQGWGDEDQDLVDAVRFAGAELAFYPADLVTHLEHSDEDRVRFHDLGGRPDNHMLNRIYRAAKWDWARIMGTPPSLPERQSLYQLVAAELDRVRRQSEAIVSVDLGRMIWRPTGVDCHRVLQYRLSPHPTGRRSDYGL